MSWATRRAGRLAAKQDLDDAFDQASGRYDLLTRLNPGYHRHLAAAAGELLARVGQREGLRLVDLGCGSGASTVALLNVAPESVAIVGVDASAGMLAQAAAKNLPDRVRLLHATAQQLAEVVETPVDGVLAAYLFRNLKPADRDLVLAEAVALLAPGGWLAVQEYSVAGSRRAELIWTVVCWLIVIPLSILVGGSPVLYRYLWRSVREFDSPVVFMDRMAAAGFSDIATRTMTGWQRGILHTFVGRRP